MTYATMRHMRSHWASDAEEVPNGARALKAIPPRRLSAPLQIVMLAAAEVEQHRTALRPAFLMAPRQMARHSADTMRWLRGELASALRCQTGAAAVPSNSRSDWCGGVRHGSTPQGFVPTTQ